ncbi:MAG TPA: cell division protein CrgA [Acidimicrobiales bacterium]|nr:cell division protein CrgA [Acidimicrobiales bacterium]
MAERKAAQRRTSGRVTPKKGTPDKVDAGIASGRYTPPIPREEKVSPMWVPVLMFALLGLGVVVIVLNYVGLMPGDTSNGYLLLGLGLITAGFITATNYH